MTRLAAAFFGVPIALISLVDAERQWFKSRHGLDVDQTERCVSFCSHTIQRSTVMVVEDALDDPRFVANPLVVDGPKIRFYAGAPLIQRSGHALGALCLIDHVPREFGPADQAHLEDMGRPGDDPGRTPAARRQDQRGHRAAEPWRRWPTIWTRSASPFPVNTPP